MNIDEFSDILRSPRGILPEQVQEINSILEEYPYFQAARAVQLKILQAQRNYRYNKALKIAAAHITDRTVLFNFINSYAPEEIFLEQYNSKSLDKNDTLTNLEETFQIPAWLYDITVVSEEILPERKSNTNSISDDNYKNKPRSFSEWLKVDRYKISDSEKKDSSVDKNKKNKFELIDRFLENNPKIEPSKDYVPNINLTDSSKPKETMLMTETLAKVFFEQRKFKEAIQAYEILILKNPEKSGFFADQIRVIKNLQQNNL